MRLFGLTVAKNEAGRYLRPMLSHTTKLVDKHFLYDDQSEDETRTIARNCGCVVRTRLSPIPSFLSNEGYFRGAAWATFEEAMHPQLGDWVLTIDCDEVLVSSGSGNPATVRKTVDNAIARARNAVAIDLRIMEVFGYQNGTPTVRLDGEWGSIHGPRLFRYEEGGRHTFGKMGVPGQPDYVISGQTFHVDELFLMHYGYAEESDRVAKHRRYSTHGGHGSAHIDSILQTPRLGVWDGPFVEEMGSAIHT